MRQEVFDGKRGSSYPILKKLAARPHEDNTAFHLPSHANYTAEVLANHFSSISQEYEPLSMSSLPPNVRNFLQNYDPHVAPSLRVSAVRQRLIRAKKPAGIFPGDLPKMVVQHCVNELAATVTLLFNTITKAAHYPSDWKIEQQIPIPKVYPPNSEDDLRNIAKTPFLSKVYESFLAEWLLSYIKPFLDPNQCGVKGSSISHYLIKLLHFVHQTLDLKKLYVVLAACFDRSKAFNRVDHILVIQDLYDMQTPAWLLNLVASYLTNRQSCQLTRNFGPKPEFGPNGQNDPKKARNLVFWPLF